jgi:hypothetical protein
VSDGSDRAALARWVRARALAHLQAAHAGVKPSVLRRAAAAVGRAILASPLTCWDPVHRGGVRAAMAAEAALRERLGPLVDLACQQLFHGHVLPVQRVEALIGEAEAAALARCACRFAEVVSDLERPDGTVALTADDGVVARCLADVLAAWEAVRARPPGERGTAAPLQAAFERARQAAGGRAPREVLGGLLRDTWPRWEILLAHADLTPEWRENLRRQGKAWPVDRGLLQAFARALYHGRGAVFTWMEAVDAPYAICTCPGPEADGGCSLLHWYYAAGLDGALFPNETDGFGQARGADGAVLPCQRFPERAGRPCLGCGCEHPLPVTVVAGGDEPAR